MDKWYSTTKMPIMLSGADSKKPVWATAGMTRVAEAFVEDHGDMGGLAKAVDRIQKNYAEELSVTDLAGMASLSVVQFERNFRKHIKETPSKYINKTRMRVACQMLLQSDLPIAEIAEKTGFKDANYCRRAVRGQDRPLPWPVLPGGPEQGPGLFRDSQDALTSGFQIYSMTVALRLAAGALTERLSGPDPGRASTCTVVESARRHASSAPFCATRKPCGIERKRITTVSSVSYRFNAFHSVKGAEARGIHVMAAESWKVSRVGARLCRNRL